MALFDGLTLNATGSFGSFSLAGGKPTVTLGGAAPELPEPTALTPAGPGALAQLGQSGSSAVAWFKRNPLAILAGIVGLVVVILALRR